MKSPADLAVVGVDPGPRPGMVMLRYSSPDPGEDSHRVLTARPEVVQCTSGVLLPCVLAILPADVRMIIVSYEEVVISAISAKTSRRKALTETARQGGALKTLKNHDARLIVRGRRATDVMTWASDERLERLGLLELTKGMVHARAAARHAIYSAYKDLNAPDPLSRNFKKLAVS